MSGNYPPGVSSGTPGAPWNEPDPPECPGCGNLIARESDHEMHCSCSNMEPGEVYTALEEQAEIEKAEARLEAMAEREMR